MWSYVKGAVGIAGELGNEEGTATAPSAVEEKPESDPSTEADPIDEDNVTVEQDDSKMPAPAVQEDTPLLASRDGLMKYRSYVLPADGCVQSTRTVQRYHPCVHDPDYVAPPGGYDPPYTIALSDSCEVRRDKVSAMYESWSSGRRHGGRRLRLDGRG